MRTGARRRKRPFFILPPLAFRRKLEFETRSRRSDRCDVAPIFPAYGKRYVRHHDAMVPEHLNHFDGANKLYRSPTQKGNTADMPTQKIIFPCGRSATSLNL
jgi:hypothetical protein